MGTKTLLFCGVILFLSSSCSDSGESSNDSEVNPVIAKIDNEDITLDELKTNFYRNREPGQDDSVEIRKFFPSYIEYRLKLHEGYQQEFHRDSTILEEFNQYGSELAYSYWVENEIKKEQIETFKKRFNHELKAFHILRELPENALPKDTARVYNHLVAVRDSLINGASPEKMNERHSSQRNGNPVGGQLAWITAGTTIQPFENVVYTLEPGEVSLPVRTRFGYHLIILQDIRPRTPQRLVGHIFVNKGEDGTGSQKIHQAFDALRSDTSWSNAVRAYSDDSSTINSDGSLGWIGYGTRFPQEFIEAVMKITPDIPYSQPLEMSYGYHIVKVDSVQTFKSSEEKDEFIAKRLEELGWLDPDRQSVFDRIANESDFQVFRQNFSLFEEVSSSNTEPVSFSNANTSLEELELIRFLSNSYTANDFQDWLNQESSTSAVMKTGDMADAYRNEIIEKHLVEITRNKFPEFASTVDHFLDGLIVFKVNEENIWKTETVNDDELKAYFESNKIQYKKEKELFYTEFTASSDNILADAHQKLTKGVNVDDLPEYDGGTRIHESTTSQPQYPVYGILEELQPGEFTAPVSVDGKKSIYILNKIEDERFLTFDEAYNRVLSDYQPVHEKKYISKLKERYNLEVYPENLY